MKNLSIVVLFIVFSAVLSASVNISGAISTNVTFGRTSPASDGIYIITGDVTVQGSASPILTIEAGVTVKFNAGRQIIIGHASSGGSSGNLVVNGTSENPVLFTANTGSPTPGYWQHIKTNSFSSAQINHAIFEYGGSVNGLVDTDCVNILIDNCTFRYSQNFGLYHDAVTATIFTPTITNCTFQNNAKTVSLPVNEGWRLGTGNNYQNNTDNSPELRTGTINSSHTWITQSVPLKLNGNVTITNSNMPCLTIGKGSALSFAESARFIVGSSSSNILRASIVADSVTFKGYNNTAGNWDGIEFLTYCDSSYVANCIIKDFGNGNAAGIDIKSNNLIYINNNTITNGLAYGIVTSSTALFSIIGNTISYCNIPLSIYPNSILYLGTGNQYLNNTDNRIYCAGGQISNSAIWKTQSIPIRFNGDLTMYTSGGMTLEIGYGAVLEFASSVYWSVGTTSSSILLGTLKATGVTFRGETQTSGFWDGLIFNTYSGNHLLSGCTIRDAGNGSAHGINISAPAMTITGSLITNCANKGLYFAVGGRANITGNTISGCGSHPISLPANAASCIGEGNFLTGNAIDKVEVRAEQINTSAVWKNPGIPYYITDNVSIYASSYPHIIILPHTTVMFPAQKGFTIGTPSSPTLKGSLEADRVTFTGSDTGVITNGLYYQANVIHERCIMTNCIIQNACHNSANAAVYANASSPKFYNCTFINNPGDGVSNSGTGTPVVDNCTFINNNGYPIKTSVNSFAVVSGVGNSFYGNNPNRILISGGTLNANAEWNNPGIPIEISSTINVYDNSLPVLKINSGVQLLFQSGTGITAGTASSPTLKGALQADGVTFSALNGTSGGWTGIVFNHYSLDTSYLRNCTIQNAGTNGNVYLNNAPAFTVESCIIRYGNYGVRLTGINAVHSIFKNYIHQNEIGIYCTSSANPLVGGSLSNSNSIAGNTTYGIQNTSANTINAEYNWWGDENGPVSRTGDHVTGNIDFTPWRTTNIGDAPAAFHLLLPAQGNVETAFNPLLDWEDATDPTPGDTILYKLEISTTANFQRRFVITYDNLTSTVYRIPEGILTDNTRYYWRVSATDTQTQTTFCIEQNRYFDLAVPEPPAAFDLLNPDYEEIVHLTSPKLSWEAAIDPDPQDIVSYWVYLDVTAGFETADSIEVFVPEVYTGFCQPGEIYYWKVVAYDLAGHQTASSTNRYYVHPDAGPRPPVAITFYPDGDDFILNWDMVPGADNYKIYCSDSAFSDFEYLDETTALTYRHVSTIPHSTHFYYIIAEDIPTRWRH